MYRITVDGITLYNPRMPEYLITQGKLNQELNTSGLLSIQIPQSNPSYGLAKLMKSVVQLYDDDELLFEGRPYSPSYNLFKDNQLTIEGELAYLNDSVYSPYSYSGDVKTFFTDLINNHNSQVDERRRFEVGNVTVTNSTEEGNITRSSEDYDNTWSIIKEKLIDKLGGYLIVRHVGKHRYIDYLQEIDLELNQSVKQSINLVNATKEYTSNDLATVILPLGEKLENEENDSVNYLTIESVNGGSKYLESEDGIERYGRILKVVHHDDITLASNLLRAAQKDLADSLGLTQTINISASDLRKAGYEEYGSFRVGRLVDVKVQNLDIDEKMLINKLTIDLLNPSQNQLTIGSERRTLTDEQYKTTVKLEESIVEINKESAQRVVNSALQTIRQVQSLITSNSEQLLSQFSDKYYDKNDTDTLLSKISTSIEQTASAITFAFNQYQTSQSEVNGNNETRFNEINRYIRFENGNIILGEEGNPIKLKQANDRISFLENDVEVAYINNKNMYITNAEITNSLKLGNFAFIPRKNGNLSFKKVK